MQRKISIAIVFLIIVSLFINIFSIECVAPPPNPDAPSDFTATARSKTRIDLTWTKGKNADLTFIERNSVPSWNRNEGKIIYQDDGTSYSDTELSEKTHYYYQAWSWDSTNDLWSDSVPADNTTFANQPPLFESPSPANGSTGNLLSLSWTIPINDPDGDTFSWTIQCSNGQTSGLITGESNGTKSLPLSGLAYSTTYKVWVNATDPAPAGSGLYTRRWYTFTTKANTPPVCGTPSPANGSTGNQMSLSWNIPINDPDGDTFSWTIQCSNGQANSGTGASNGIKLLALSGLAYSTAYTVWVNATDSTGSNQWTRRWYTFNTKANTPPVYGTPSPANGSTGNLLTLSWSIPINDLEGDAFNWVIYCSNGQTNNSTGDTNGTKSVSLTGLAYSTIYTVWVNATDPVGTAKYTHMWYTFTTMEKGNTPPVLGAPSPSNGSTGNLLSLIWSILINDTEGDKFSWTIQCSNGQTMSINGASNGSKSLSLTGLAYSTTYMIWVNTTDPVGTGSKQYTRKWYTFITKSSGGGGGGGGEEPPVEPQNKKPIADVSAGEPYQGFVNATILFNGSRSSDPDGTIITWFWVFGDTTSGTGKTVNHTFLKTGTYTVTLTVTDDDGATHTDTTTCVIKQPNRRPTTPIITGPLNGTKNTVYTYTVLSTDADNDTIRYSITWGDETSYINISTFLPSGTPFTCNHSWTMAGRYVITVRVTDNQNQSSSKITVYIDTKQIGNIGYLFDDDSDGIYDAFYSDSSKQITTVQNQNGSYNIDSDDDGKWDYTFSTTNELAEYQEPPLDIQLFFIIGAIALVSIWAILISLWMRKTKEHN
jgi:hypothetical protein